MRKQYRAVSEKGNDNFSTSIYEEDEWNGLLVARCNQNGRHSWHTQAILHGLKTFQIGEKSDAQPSQPPK